MTSFLLQRACTVAGISRLPRSLSLVCAQIRRSEQHCIVPLATQFGSSRDTVQVTSSAVGKLPAGMSASILATQSHKASSRLRTTVAAARGYARATLQTQLHAPSPSAGAKSSSIRSYPPSKAAAVSPPPVAQELAPPPPPAGRKLTGWIVFCKEQRPVCQASNPHLKMIEVTKILAQQWKSLTPAVQAQYNQTAASLPPVPVKAKLKRNSSPKPASNRKPVAPNGFMMFAKEQRPRIKAMFPGAKVPQMTKLIAQEWNKLSDAQKAVYKERGQKEFLAAQGNGTA